MKPRPVFPILLAVVLLTGCAQRETDVEAGIRTQTLLVGNLAEPETLDPNQVWMYSEFCIARALFEGLTVPDEMTGEALPGVAERWEVSPDGLTYTFHLRPDARWSNGDPTTAEDFAYSFRRILSPRLGAKYALLFWRIKNAREYNCGRLNDVSAVGIEAPDPRTLRLTLERPCDFLPALAAHPAWMPVHRPTVENAGATDDRTARWTRPGLLVGNGPFTLEEWRADVRVVVRKNPRYRAAAQTRLERVVFLPIEDNAVEERNFRAGQVHVTVDVPLPMIARYREIAPAQLRIEPFFASWFLSINTARPPLNNPKVRRALSLAIDRDRIAQRVFLGARRPAAQLVPPGLRHYPASARAATDLATARRLLAEAGFPDGRGFPEIELQCAPSLERPKMAEVIQEGWRHELGIRLRVAVFENKITAQSRENHAYELSFCQWGAEYPDPVGFLELFRSTGSNNWTGWSNRAYDRLLEEAADTRDPARRFALLQEAEALLLEEAPIAPVIFDCLNYLIHPAVRGWAPSPFGLHLYQRVWLEP